MSIFTNIIHVLCAPPQPSSRTIQILMCHIREICFAFMNLHSSENAYITQIDFKINTQVYSFSYINIFFSNTTQTCGYTRVHMMRCVVAASCLYVFLVQIKSTWPLTNKNVYTKKSHVFWSSIFKFRKHDTFCAFISNTIKICSSTKTGEFPTNFYFLLSHVMYF